MGEVFPEYHDLASTLSQKATVQQEASTEHLPLVTPQKDVNIVNSMRKSNNIYTALKEKENVYDSRFSEF
jgi:hypothetical protein